MKLRFAYLFLFIYFSYNDDNNEEIENFLEKHKTLKTTKNYVIFDSSSFKKGSKMNFKLKSEFFCDRTIKYTYLDDINNFGPDTSLPYNVSFSKEEFQIKKKILMSKTKYFTIKKNKNEYNGQDGNNLLLYFACSGTVEIENNKKKLNGGIIFLIVLVILLVLLAGAGAAYYFLIYKKKNKTHTPSPSFPPSFGFK